MQLPRCGPGVWDPTPPERRYNPRQGETPADGRPAGLPRPSRPHVRLERRSQAGNLCPDPEGGREPSLQGGRTRFGLGGKALKHSLLYKRDFYAGGLMILFGLFATLNGPRYTLGTLMHMGPGFMPTALGVILTLLGIVIAGSALAEKEGEGEEGILPEHPQWFAWGCILASPLAFILFGKFGGMIPGTFMCVFVAALGDRDATWRGIVSLSAVVTFFGVALFHYLLKIPMPVLKWDFL
jgi:hypothetical protein